MKKSILKKIFMFMLIFSFIFSNFPKLKITQAKNNTFPAELATPNEPLVAGEEASFFIIINDEEIKKKLVISFSTFI